MKTAVANRPEETNLFHILQTPPCKSVFEELQSLKLPETKKKKKPKNLTSYGLKMVIVWKEELGC